MKVIPAARRMMGATVTRVRRAIERRAADRGWESSLPLRALEAAGAIPFLGPNCLHWAGFMHAADGRHDRAIAAYEAARDRGLSGDASLHHDLGLSLLRTGRPEQAEAEFRAALRLARGETWPTYGLVDALVAQRRPHEVVPALLTTAKDPGMARSLPFPDWLAESVDRDEAQVEALRALVRRHPDAEHATILLARVETLRSNVPVATELFRRAGKSRWGTSRTSSSVPTKPSFLVIGQAKAGTSAFFQYLSAHPSIEPPLVKEPGYWSDHHGCGPDWYAAQFPPLQAGDGRITGEASTNYLVDPAAPARVAAALPGVKLVVLLRDPVARAWSEHWMQVRLGERDSSFEERVTTEMRETPECPLDHAPIDDGRIGSGLLLRSAALPHLKRWLAHVEPEQLLVLHSRGLERDLPQTMRRAYRFLGVSPIAPSDQRRHNEGRYPDIPADLERRLREWFEPHERALEAFLATLPETHP